MSREELALINSSIRQAPCDRFEYPQMQCSESPFAYVGMSGPKDEYPVYDGAVRLPPASFSCPEVQADTPLLVSAQALRLAWPSICAGMPSARS